jgi:hypothetical protein
MIVAEIFPLHHAAGVKLPYCILTRGVKSPLHYAAGSQIFLLHDAAGSQILPLHNAAGSQILPPHDAVGSQFGSRESSLKNSGRLPRPLKGQSCKKIIYGGPSIS